jgi:hypothetical protein
LRRPISISEKEQEYRFLYLFLTFLSGFLIIIESLLYFKSVSFRSLRKRVISFLRGFLHLYTPIEGIARNAPTSPSAGYVYGRGMACHVLLPGLLRRKRLAMTMLSARHCEDDSLKQSGNYHYYNKIITNHYIIHCKTINL